jgi:KDO2-lipid IV(A) lauroyltransferase
MTLPARLALQYGARVSFVVGERLPAGRGWRLHFDLLDEPLSGDSEADAALLNRRLEAVIRRRPAQYLWGYNRYKSPAGAPLAPAGKPA